jgi:hypothetical protein
VLNIMSITGKKPLDKSGHFQETNIYLPIQ